MAAQLAARLRRRAGRTLAGLGFVVAFAGVAALLQLTAPPAVETRQLAESPERFGVGRPATDADIRALDIDVMPDGTGLPPGRGTVAEGAAIYARKCAVCHGRSGEGGINDRLVGRDPRDPRAFSEDPAAVKTVGNYWPYATTLYDYTARAMPFLQPGTLTADEVYSLVAYILHLNEIVAEDAVMTSESLPKVIMPARDRFVEDDRRGGPEIR